MSQEPLSPPKIVLRLMIRINMKRISQISFILIALSFFIAAEPLVSQEKTIDDQANEISNSLLCPVCQGQSVAESNSKLANDMRQVIRKKLQEGQTREEILAYFIDTYGETILGAPPAKGVNWFLWILPALAIVFGLLGIGVFLYNAGSDKEETTSGAPEPVTKPDDEYLNKIDEELKNNDS